MFLVPYIMHLLHFCLQQNCKRTAVLPIWNNLLKLKCMVNMYMLKLLINFAIWPKRPRSQFQISLLTDTKLVYFKEINFLNSCQVPFLNHSITTRTAKFLIIHYLFCWDYIVFNVKKLKHIVLDCLHEIFFLLRCITMVHGRTNATRISVEALEIYI